MENIVVPALFAGLTTLVLFILIETVAQVSNSTINEALGYAIIIILYALAFCVHFLLEN